MLALAGMELDGSGWDGKRKKGGVGSHESICLPEQLLCVSRPCFKDVVKHCSWMGSTE